MQSAKTFQELSSEIGRDLAEAEAAHARGLAALRAPKRPGPRSGGALPPAWEAEPRDQAAHSARLRVYLAARVVAALDQVNSEFDLSGERALTWEAFGGVLDLEGRRIAVLFAPVNGLDPLELAACEWYDALPPGERRAFGLRRADRTRMRAARRLRGLIAGLELGACELPDLD